MAAEAAIAVMPVLGIAKHRLGRRLGSEATTGEGTQNLMRAAGSRRAGRARRHRGVAGRVGR